MSQPKEIAEKIRESWPKLADGSLPALALNRTSNEPAKAVFAGAFNPLHEGHRKMAEVAASLLNAPVEFEISIANVDKVALDLEEVQHRIRQFSPQQPIWLTRAATFVEKSKLFRKATFVVGADTVLRIGQAAYYGNDPGAVEAAIDKLAAADCRFLVFGRLMGGSFITTNECDLPERLLELCQQVPETDFRTDVSSSELRL
jgi:hypothetical protein